MRSLVSIVECEACGGSCGDEDTEETPLVPEDDEQDEQVVPAVPVVNEGVLDLKAGNGKKVKEVLLGAVQDMDAAIKKITPPGISPEDISKQAGETLVQIAAPVSQAKQDLLKLLRRVNEEIDTGKPALDEGLSESFTDSENEQMQKLIAKWIRSFGGSESRKEAVKTATTFLHQIAFFGTRNESVGPKADLKLLAQYISGQYRLVSAPPSIEVTASDKEEAIAVIKSAFKAMKRAHPDASTAFGWKHKPGEDSYTITLTPA